MIVAGTLVNLGLTGLFGWLMSRLHDPIPYIVVAMFVFLAPELLKHVGYWLIRKERTQSHIEGN
jgi:hypothetical protein